MGSLATAMTWSVKPMAKQPRARRKTESSVVRPVVG